MRSRIKKHQVHYLVGLLTNHAEGHPDDLAKWIQCIKLAYRVLITLDNMGIDEETDEATVITLDRIYVDLKNDFQRNSIYFPIDRKYYK